MKRYQNIAANIVEFIDTVADAIREQLKYCLQAFIPKAQAM